MAILRTPGLRRKLPLPGAGLPESAYPLGPDPELVLGALEGPGAEPQGGPPGLELRGAKNRLLQAGFLEGATVPIARTRRMILRPTRQAQRLLRLSPGTTPESVEHEFWKQHYADKLRRAGYLVEVEAPRHGGKADVVGRIDKERIAVEVETGKSDAVGNVRNCLLSRMHQVVVVAASPEARTSIETSLGRERLLIRGRVLVVLRDEFIPEPASLHQA